MRPISLHRSMCRTSLIIAALLGMLSPCWQPDSADADEVTTMAQLRDARRKAQHRQRRIIFNNDGCDAVYYCDKPTREELLSKRTTPLPDSQIDTMVYCTWNSGFSHFIHNTKIGHVFTCKANPPGAARGYGFAKNIVGELVEQGTDPLEIMVDFAREHDIEVFWSMRMNDTHDAGNTWYQPYAFPQLKKDHPEWLLGSREDRPKHGRWSAVDYSRPEIRDLAFRFAEEVCRNYDIDGINLDFFRHLNYFPRPAAGLEASQEELDMMTDLMRRMRAMTEQVGLERGKPILVLVRVPDSVGYCKAHGLDIERWLDEGLVDLLVTTGYFRLNPWQYSVELGHKHGVPVYPCLSESRLRDREALSIRRSDAAYRARARNVWFAGADGVYLFNMFQPQRKFCDQIGELATLNPTDKVYTTGARGVRTARSWQHDGDRFLNRNPVSPQRPRVLKPGASTDVELVIGEDLADRPKSLTPQVMLKIRFAELDQPDQLAVSLNGSALPTGQVSDGWLEIGLRPEDVAQGVNHFKLTLAKDASKPARVEDLVVWVRYEKAE